MPTIPASDLQEMFSLTELADVALIESVSVLGVFDNEYLDGLDVIGTSPVFTCAASDLYDIVPAVGRGTVATINSVNFTIENIKNDGTGVTTLSLSEV